MAAEDAWPSILGLGLLFAGSHLLLSSRILRPRLVSALGPGGFLGLYSAVALATFAPFAWLWWTHRHGGPLLFFLRDLAALRILAAALSLAGVALVAAALFQPSPLSLGAGSAPAARGLVRVTRHALFVGFGLFGLGHLLMNGWAADLAFFAVLAAFSLVGALHQDARKRSEDPGRFGPFFAETSLVPFAAILAGRNRLVLSELPWPALAAGVAAGWILYLLHPRVFAPG